MQLVSTKCEHGKSSAVLPTGGDWHMVTVHVLKDNRQSGVVPVQFQTLHPQGR